MIEEAVADIVAQLTALALDRGDDNGPIPVLDFMPTPDKLIRPAAIAVWFAEMTDTEIGVNITLACDTSSDPEAAEKLARSLVPQLDAGLDAITPRSFWRKSWSDIYNAYLAETTLAYPRDDF